MDNLKPGDIIKLKDYDANLHVEQKWIYLGTHEETKQFVTLLDTNTESGRFRKYEKKHFDELYGNVYLPTKESKTLPSNILNEIERNMKEKTLNKLEEDIEIELPPEVKSKLLDYLNRPEGGRPIKKSRKYRKNKSSKKNRKSRKYERTKKM
jgi:hypothetical protein